MKRNWSKFLHNLGAELNSTSGAAGLGGAIMGLASWTLLGGALIAQTLALVGAGVSLFAFGYSFWRAIPPVLVDAADVAGKTISLPELQNIWPRIPTLAIIGLSQAGKTTLRHALKLQGGTSTRTQQIGADVVALATTTSKQLAILDGGGEKWAQQFRIAESGDCLIIILDHNASHEMSDVDAARLTEAAGFLAQVRHHLDENDIPKKKWVYFLINKSDLWSKGDQQQLDRFKDFYMAEAKKWEDSGRTHEVRVMVHSNEQSRDVSSIANLLQRTV